MCRKNRTMPTSTHGAASQRTALPLTRDRTPRCVAPARSRPQRAGDTP